MNAHMHRQILGAYSGAAVRGFFRPKPNERVLAMAIEAARDEDVKRELRMHPKSYLYLGTAIELVSAFIMFALIVGFSLVANHFFVQAIVKNSWPPKFEGLVDLISGGTSFVALGLLTIFALKLIRDFLVTLVDA